MSEKKVFDDFPVKECDNCERWWTNQCDGHKCSEIPSRSSKLTCTSFLPIRSVTIPQKVEKLSKDVKWLTRCVDLWGGAVIMILLMILMG